MIAQGNALGQQNQVRGALQGRLNLRIEPPLQGSARSVDQFPRALPWAIMIRTVGPREGAQQTVLDGDGW